MSTADTSHSYDDYASVYDSFKGSRSDDINRIADLIRTHRPNSKTVLELACGTGLIMKGLDASYKMTGLDNSQAMLELARRKLPHSTFYLADMSDFHLGQKFDVIYCVHNSLNHLLAFKDWVSMFQCVSRQLKKDGLFIFDLNSEERLERLSRGNLGFYPAGEHYVMTKVSKHPERRERYNWEMRLFIRKDAFSFTLQPTTVEVSTYPVSDVLQALSRNFTLLDTFTLSDPTPDDFGRMYFVCRKW